MSGTAHTFGGSWTEQKLSLLDQYLSAYTTALKNQPFILGYIDAFAGTGTRTAHQPTDAQQAALLDFPAEEAAEFFDGSVRIALRTDPPFQHFVFIESDRRRYAALDETLKSEFPEIYNSGKVQILKQDANTAIQNLLKTSSPDYRAVMFLDPYGMQVSWKTIEGIAASRIIDLLVLFPIGMGVNRLLRKDGRIRESEKRRLTDCFGSADWESKFYKQSDQRSLFSPEDEAVKTANFETIANHYNDRLKSVFEAVATNPVWLRNSKNSPLYALCFAASNAKGAPIAVRIATHIFKKASG